MSDERYIPLQPGFVTTAQRDELAQREIPELVVSQSEVVSGEGPDCEPVGIASVSGVIDCSPGPFFG